MTRRPLILIGLTRLVVILGDKGRSRRYDQELDIRSIDPHGGGQR